MRAKEVLALGPAPTFDPNPQGKPVIFTGLDGIQSQVLYLRFHALGAREFHGAELRIGVMKYIKNCYMKRRTADKRSCQYQMDATLSNDCTF